MPHLTQELAQFIYQLRPNDIPTSGTAAAQKVDLARWEKPIKATGVQLD